MKNEQKKKLYLPWKKTKHLLLKFLKIQKQKKPLTFK